MAFLALASQKSLLTLQKNFYNFSTQFKIKFSMQHPDDGYSERIFRRYSI